MIGYEGPEPLGPIFDDVEREFQIMERVAAQRTCRHPEWVDVTCWGDAVRREVCASCGLERRKAAP